MRNSIMARTLVSVSAVAAIAAGSLAGASASFAAPASDAKPAVSTKAVTPQAVNNLGLNTARAKNWQCWLKKKGFNPGTIDGKLGSDSWKAAQRMFRVSADGIVGPDTIRGLQKYLNGFGYGLVVDGDAGTKTRAAFWQFNANC
ncbi:peptidoglycan-binding domain-containing protein [Streptomyces sp. Je 1-369]|uniref:peptidoglycan-binding domain-containing protein n=1 Tax=Streptomyces sp. Je 1-369 TaxID=2966192 RepID=UPI002285C871|nr:peptidoglycan-binding domain-containing protein [Streptomyces sp. Je 1-369]WAL99711.1 peptidoglycan-binding protein [Streptomyces sp. Je 1-369]